MRTTLGLVNTYSSNAAPIVLAAEVRTLGTFHVKATLFGNNFGYKEIRINYFPSEETWKRVTLDPTRQSYTHHRFAGMEEESMFFKTTPIANDVLLTKYNDMGSKGGDGSTGGDVPSSICKVCGEGKIVANPDAMMTIPQSTDSVECSQIELAGLGGMLPMEQCDMISSIVAQDCGCV